MPQLTFGAELRDGGRRRSPLVMTAPPPNTCYVVSARGYHGPGPYPCSPNEARRAGCRAMPPSSLSPSLSDPEPGQLWARSHVSRRFPCEKLPRWRDSTAQLGSSVQRCVHQLRQHLPALPPHRALMLLLLLLRAAGARLTTCIPSLCAAVCQCRRPPTVPADAQNLTGKSMLPMSVQTEEKKRPLLEDGVMWWCLLQWSDYLLGGARRHLVM
ncbi:unnamed protein product [Pleuronectes platessa]|uniref:Uncharacterized protein n=1 Tax=Pleuronectes platessa TaxID=8262 RepID=A0A9N7VB49_PLEPL|nr:unnamed protein product [Pleuronectes platessa]